MTSEEFDFDEHQFEQHIPCHGYFMRRKAVSIKKIIPVGSRCLDIGCGTGTMERLVNNHFSEMIGFDPSPTQIGQAKKLGLKNCKFMVGNSTSLPYLDNSFDAILLVNVMHHIDPDKHIKTLAEAFRVMKKGGILLTYEHNPLHPLVYLRFYYCSQIDKGAHMINPFLMKKNISSAGFIEPRIKWMISEAFGEYFVSGKKKT